MHNNLTNFSSSLTVSKIRAPVVEILSQLPYIEENDNKVLNGAMLTARQPRGSMYSAARMYARDPFPIPSPLLDLLKSVIRF